MSNTFAIGIGFLLMGIFALMMYSIIKDRNKHWKEIDPKNAKQMCYHGLDYTNNKGTFFVRVSDFQWVQLHWDKQKKYLLIQRPPKTWEHMQKHPIYESFPNWKVGMNQPIRTTLEKYMKRQVM